MCFSSDLKAASQKPLEVCLFKVSSARFAGVFPGEIYLIQTYCGQNSCAIYIFDLLIEKGGQ